jgi:hypothetical protein
VPLDFFLLSDKEWKKFDWNLSHEIIKSVVFGCDRSVLTLTCFFYLNCVTRMNHKNSTTMYLISVGHESGEMDSLRKIKKAYLLRCGKTAFFDGRVPSNR